MSDDQLLEKRCSKCGHTKPFDAFSRSKGNKDGRQSQCKACVAQYNAACAEARHQSSRAYRAANADIIREQKRAYYAANAEARRECNRAYRASHIEQEREYSRAYYAANAEEIQERHHAYRAANADAYREQERAYRATNAEAIRKQSRAYYAANAEVIQKRHHAYRAANANMIREYIRTRRTDHPDIYRAAWHRYRARQKSNGGTFTTQELKHMRATQGGFCTYCQHFHGDALTIDHIIPLKQGGRHEAANICLACPRCNFSKGNRTPDQWLNRWYWDWRRREPEYIPPHWQISPMAPAMR